MRRYKYKTHEKRRTSGSPPNDCRSPCKQSGCYGWVYAGIIPGGNCSGAFHASADEADTSNRPPDDRDGRAILRIVRVGRALRPRGVVTASSWLAIGCFPPVRNLELKRNDRQPMVGAGRYGANVGASDAHSLDSADRRPCTMMLIKSLLSRIRSFLRGDSGPTAVEYAFLLVLILVVALTAITLLGHGLRRAAGAATITLLGYGLHRAAAGLAAATITLLGNRLH